MSIQGIVNMDGSKQSSMDSKTKTRSSDWSLVLSVWETSEIPKPVTLNVSTENWEVQWIQVNTLALSDEISGTVIRANNHEVWTFDAAAIDTLNTLVACAHDIRGPLNWIISSLDNLQSINDFGLLTTLCLDLLSFVNTLLEIAEKVNSRHKISESELTFLDRNSDRSSLLTNFNEKIIAIDKVVKNLSNQNIPEISLMSLNANVETLKNLNALARNPDCFIKIPFSISERITDNLRAMYSNMDPDVEIVVTIDSNVPDRIVWYPFKLHQILSDLVCNAVKYTTEWEVRIIVTINENSELSFEVKDTWRWINSDDLSTIFELFWKSGNATWVTRSWVWLNSVKDRCNAIGCGISVDSTIWQWSSFILTTDYEAYEDSFKEIVRINDILLWNNWSNSVDISRIWNKTILIVDDDIEMLSLLQARLSKFSNIKLFTATCAREAIDIVDKQWHELDLVFMDQVIPWTCWVDVSKQIKLQWCNCPVIWLTANWDIACQLTNFFENWDINAVYRKSADFSTLNNTINTWCNHVDFNVLKEAYDSIDKNMSLLSSVIESIWHMLEFNNIDQLWHLSQLLIAISNEIWAWNISRMAKAIWIFEHHPSRIAREWIKIFERLQEELLRVENEIWQFKQLQIGDQKLACFA